MVTDVDRTALFEDAQLSNYIDEKFIAIVFTRLHNMFDKDVDTEDLAEAEESVIRLCKNLVKVAIIHGNTGFDDTIDNYTDQTIKDNRFTGLKILLPVYNKFALLLADRLKINISRKIKDMPDIKASRDKTVDRNVIN